MNSFSEKETAVALGTFDGLHKGHISVILPCCEKAESGLTPLVLLFSKHPEFYLTGNAPSMLLTDSYRNSLIKELGADYYVIDFKKIRNLTPEEFVRDVLKSELNAKFVSCGFNYRFAKNGTGTTETLKTLCEKYGIGLNITPEVMFNNEPVSSSRIRNAVKTGKINEANKMLSRPFSFDFEIIHGDKIGRTIGFPTANQQFPDNFTVPKYGVYASRTTLNGRIYPSVSNIGLRPTLNGSDLRCETHVIGLNENLYGTKPLISLTSFLRTEIKFRNLDELKNQITEDKEKVIKIFSQRDNVL